MDLQVQIQEVAQRADTSDMLIINTKSIISSFPEAFPKSIKILGTCFYCTAGVKVVFGAHAERETPKGRE